MNVRFGSKAAVGPKSLACAFSAAERLANKRQVQFHREGTLRKRGTLYSGTRARLSVFMALLDGTSLDTSCSPGLRRQGYGAVLVVGQHCC